jgi:transketolase
MTATHSALSPRAPFRYIGAPLRLLSDEIRLGTFRVCRDAKDGHIGGSSSSVELFTALYFGGYLRYDPTDLRHPARDRVLVRGHLGPVRYKILSLLGEIAEEELPDYRKFGSRLHGHEEWQEVPGVDLTPSGSLGMLLSYGVGSAIAARDTGTSHRTWVFLGDGEEQEGNVAEAARHAAHLGLMGLVVVLDQNGKQLSNPVSDIDRADVAAVWKAYGWRVHVIEDGHDLEQVRQAYDLAMEVREPLFILAKTDKGRGLEACESHFSGYHTIGTCPSGLVDSAIEALNASLETSAVLRKEILEEIRSARATSGPRPKETFEAPAFRSTSLDLAPGPDTSRNLDTSQVEYYQRLMTKLSHADGRTPFYFVTADVTREDHARLSRLAEFTCFMNVGIREQHSLAMSHGLSLTLPSARILVNGLDAFTYRGIDQLNAICHGGSSVVIVADCAGLTNARNGKSHQSAGQPGALVSMPGLTLLEPGDTTDLYNSLNWALGESRGAVVIRTFRANIEPFSAPGQKGAEKLRYYEVVSCGSPDCVVVASGATVGPSVSAAKLLAAEGIAVRVVNVLNQKSLDAGFVALIADGKPVVTAYNGAPEVLQGTVSSALLRESGPRPEVVRSVGFHFGTSGAFDDLARHFGLDADGIAREVSRVVAR